jgi:hypothetical protein
MEQLRELYTCSITSVITNDPILTTCGHFFDRAAINTWRDSGRENADRCPVCRSLFEINSFPFLQQTSDAVRLLFADDIYNDEQISAGLALSVQVDEPLAPEFVPVSDDENEPDLILFAPDSPIDGPVDIPIGRSPFLLINQGEVPNVNVPIGARLVDLRDQPFSRQSVNPLSAAVSQHLNHRFILRYAPDIRLHPWVLIRRYRYQAQSPSISEAARNIARRGFYVFDLSYTNIIRGEQHQFILESFDIGLSLQDIPYNLHRAIR